MKYFVSTIIITVLFFGCKKKEKEDCNVPAITTTKRDANVGQSNGWIKITSPRGSNYQYSINSGLFQTDSLFNNLAIGTYTVSVKDNKNCTASATVTLVDPCAGVTTTVNTSKVDAITGQTNGSITVTAPLGSGVTYSLGGGAYQASQNFNNLSAGSYTINAKTAVGCIGTTTATITGYGPKYYLVKQVIQGYCGPCHLNGGNSGNITFDTDASIVNSKARIKARAVDNIPSVMPQGGPLTAQDKQKITDWINAGGTMNN